MKLSLLIDYLRRVEQISTQTIAQNTADSLQDLVHRVSGHSAVRYEKYSLSVDMAVKNVQSQFNNLSILVQELKAEVQQAINQVEPFYLQRSFSQFLDYEILRSQEMQVLSRRLDLSESISQELRHRIVRYQNWIYPGLVVRPGNSCWLDDFRTDPLYVLDYTHSQIDQAICHLPTLLQQRICKYTINETPGKAIADFLPADQFGICLLYYYFNFRPIEIIRQWLSELYNVTRPGGHVVFTYNDCDQPHGVANYESGFMSYTPGHMIRDYAENLGFEIVRDWQPHADLSWMELRKPGTMITQRAAQCLARVVARPK